MNRPAPFSNIEVCILAGGLSSRMGRDKSTLRVGGRSLLSMVRRRAQSLGVPVRVIRKDAVPRCGPLGGVVTALRSTQFEFALFLACDMPFVSCALMEKLAQRCLRSRRPVFAAGALGPGFPFLLPANALGEVEEQIAARCFSVQQLAVRLRAASVRASEEELCNINTPAEWEEARRLLKGD